MKKVGIPTTDLRDSGLTQKVEISTPRSRETAFMRSAPLTRKTPLRATWDWGYTRWEPVRTQKLAANGDKFKEAA